MRKLLTIFFFLPLLLGAQQVTLTNYQKQDSLTFLVIMGESNASGQAPNTLVLNRYLGNRSEVQITHNGTGSVVKFENLNIANSSTTGNNQLLAYDGTPKFGLELAIANMVDSGILPNPVYVCKQGFPGSMIADWLPGGARNAQFIPSLDSAFAQMNRIGKPYRVYVWQSIGINDQGNGTLVDSFVSRMAQYRSYFRTRYSVPTAVFLETRFSNPHAFSSPGYVFPWAAQIDAMAVTDPYFHSIPCDFTTYVSGQSPIHWDLNGFGTVAHNMLDTMLRLTGKSLLLTDWFGQGRGAEQWMHAPWDNSTQSNGVNVPAGSSTPGPNYYTRLNWTQIEGATIGSYNFSTFDTRVHQAMDARQRFSFRVMTVCDGCTPAGTVPAYLQTLIEGNGNANLRGYTAVDGTYIPNWNNPDYQTRYKALLTAIANHIASTSYTPSWSGSPVPYSKVVYQIDIGGYGNYGEFHQFPWVLDAGFPSRIIPTAAALDSIITAHQQIFPDYQAMALIAGFGAGAGTAGTQFEPPTEVGYRLLTSSTNVGQFGWRRDNWGDSTYSVDLVYNSRSYNPGTGNVAFQPLIMNKYKFGPVSGEPLNGLSNNNQWGCGSPYCDLPIETFLYHAVQVGNGNFFNPGLLSTQQSFQMASRQMGYKFFIGRGTMTTTLTSGGTFNINQYWTNQGQTPTYETWKVRYELRTAGGTVVWTGKSTFNPRPLLPGATLQQNDNFTLTTVANGTYNLFMVVEDTTGYKLPMALMIANRGADGFYPIRSGISVGGVANIPPTANISPSPVNLTLPTNSQLFTGAGSTDPDGSITTYLWAQVSGPNSASLNTPNSVTCTMSGMIAGAYVFNLLVTDNLGATGSANVSVNVNNANIPPTAIITPTGTTTIQQPINSVALSGTSSSDPDGSIASYSWTYVSGPAGYVIGTPTASTSTVSNLATGTYQFKLTVTDNSGATGSVNKIIVVTAPVVPPTAQINGSNLITQPTSSVVLDGTTSFAAAGNSITAYAWSKVSGPGGSTIVSPTASSTNVTGLVLGSYIFQLQVTDNVGSTGIDTILVVVQANGGQATIFTTQTPSGGILNDGTPLTLGVKFRSTQISMITGIRFYKIQGNNGTHQGMLYDSVGNLLAQAVFSNETSSGWQTVTFSTPVLIQANQTYVAAYFAPLGTYQEDDNYFTSSGVTNGFLTALKTGVSGVNGVYNYGAAPVFPTLTFLNGNYWVDVSALSNIPPTAVISGVNFITYPTDSTNLSGIGSIDLDGTISSYLWTLVSGPNCPVIESPTSSTTHISGLGVGAYVFQLVVTDNSGASDSATTTVTVQQGLSTTYTTGFTSQTPVSGVTNDNPVEVGVKFKSDIDILAAGVRFWKSVGNNGVHSGHLWNPTAVGSSGSDSALMASVTFTSESSSGWQTAFFSTPVLLKANKTYVVSYFSPNGTYTKDDNYFTTKVTNTILTLLADGTDGPNGVYTYSTSPAFPFSPIGGGVKTNYWVDIIVLQGVGSSCGPNCLPGRKFGKKSNGNP